MSSEVMSSVTAMAPLRQQAPRPHPAQATTPTAVRVVWHPVAALMGGGFAARRGSAQLVVLDPSLVGPERSAALLHELVHLERGGGCEVPGAPVSWDVVAAREERAVEAEVANRLVPRGALAHYVRSALANGDGVTAAAVAEEFDVPERVARRALVALGTPTVTRDTTPLPGEPVFTPGCSCAGTRRRDP